MGVINEFDYRDMVARMGVELANQIVAQQNNVVDRGEPLDLTDMPAITPMVDMLNTVRNDNLTTLLKQTQGVLASR